MTKKALTAQEFRELLLRERAARPKPPPLPWHQSAMIYALRHFLWVVTTVNCGMTLGDRDTFEAFHPPVIPPTDLGRDVLAALKVSRMLTPEHPEWKKFTSMIGETSALEQEFKDRARVRSQKALYSGGASVTVTNWGDRVEIEPAKYRTRGHWEGGIPSIILDPDTTADEIGKAAWEAIRLSREASWGTG